MIRMKPLQPGSFKLETLGSRTGASVPVGSLPLLFLNYFAANLDDWDPKVTNGLAAEHEVILFDNAGVGSSTGTTPPTVAAMTKDCADFCRAARTQNLRCRRILSRRHDCAAACI